MNAFDIEARQQDIHVGLVLRVRVVRRIGQPVAAAASGHVDGHDAIPLRQSVGQAIEVMRVARQAVDADHHV